MPPCRYEDGSVAEVTSSVVHHGEEQGIVLQCEKAKPGSPLVLCGGSDTDQWFSPYRSITGS